jgi:ABC-2 type transport system permease protein
MPIVRTVATKELRQLAATRSMLLIGLLSAVFFSLVLSGGEADSPGEMPLLVPMLVGLSLGYHGSSQLFLREKTGFVIETLLCSPVSLRDLWLGKTLAVTVFGGVFALGVGMLAIVLASVRSGIPVLPDCPAVLFLAVVVPLSVACMAGARGYIQLLLGARESHFASLGMLMAVVLLLGASGFGPVLTSSTALAVGLIAAAVLFALAWCSRFLSVERIVTSL